MIIEVRVYQSRAALAEGEAPFSEFKVNDERHEGRKKLARCSWWAMRNGHCLVTYPMHGQPPAGKRS